LLSYLFIRLPLSTFSRNFLALKYTKCVNGRGSAPDPAGELTASAPDSLAGFRGGKGRLKGEWKREGEEREEEEEEVVVVFKRGACV